MRTFLALGLALAGCVADDIDQDFETQAADTRPPDAPAPGAAEVTFGRDTSERIYGLRIHDRAHRQPRVVYSVRLADVRADEKLLLRGEVTLSRCNHGDITGQSGDAGITPCDRPGMQDDPYDYNPRYSAAFVLAGSPTDASGTRVSSWFDRRCPEPQHHCSLALPEVAVTDLAPAAERFVNLIVTADADGANARDWHVMEVEQNKGALAVTRVAAGAGGVAIEKRTENLRAPQHMGIDRPAEDGDPTQVRHLIYQVELTGLRGGDVIATDARLRAVLDAGYSCNPLITGLVLVTRDRDARQPRGTYDEEITIKNGANCADHSNDGCKYEESGAVRLRNGAPDTMYVSYLAIALRSCASPGGNDTWHATPDGFLDVRVRR